MERLKTNKTCPFCGGFPFYITETLPRKDIGTLTVHRIHCSSCPCNISTVKGKDELIKMWERRTQQSEKVAPMKDTKYMEAWHFLEHRLIRGDDVPKEVLDTLYELVKMYYKENDDEG